MLSYQHAYHAGSRADIHKHDLFCRVLESLCAGKDPVTCVETHAGRGLYNLTSKEADKTGEANDGWLKFCGDKKFLSRLSPAYVEMVQSLNEGKMMPRYPGSPALAVHILRSQDKLHLMELHPTEYTNLKKNFIHDKRLGIYKQDGLEGAMLLNGPLSVLLVDPSYEVKAEYETLPDFVSAFTKKWPKAAMLIWVPMLPALRHEAMVKTIQKNSPHVKISEITWAKPGEVRGMYGSIMMGINCDDVFNPADYSFIR